jgi:hypothetical protein
MEQGSKKGHSVDGLMGSHPFEARRSSQEVEKDRLRLVVRVMGDKDLPDTGFTGTGAEEFVSGLARCRFEGEGFLLCESGNISSLNEERRADELSDEFLVAL